MAAAVTAAFVLGAAGGFAAKGITIGQANPQANSAPALAPQSADGPASYRAIRGGLQLGDTAVPAEQSSAGSAAAGDCVLVNRHKAC